jgi:hypothetical protein
MIGGTLNYLARKFFNPQGGMFRELKGITTHFVPRDVELYRKLLPEPFTMPEQPVVTIFLADYQIVYS